MSVMSMIATTASATVAEAAAEVEKGAHGAAESAGLPQLDATTWPSQIFWLTITFGFLYWFMSSFILPKLGGMIEERRDRIADDLDQAAEFRHQAEQAEAGYNKALADAKAKAQAIAAETRGTLDAEIADMQGEADEKAATALAAAETRIGEMKNQATAKVREAAVETTKSIVEVLIDERPADDTIAAAMPQR